MPSRMAWRFDDEKFDLQPFGISSLGLPYSLVFFLEGLAELPRPK